MKQLTSILLLILAVTMLHAQAPAKGGNGVIKGQVVESGKKQPMEYANVILMSQKDSSMVTGTITNSNGEFTLTDIPVGNYILQATFIGFKKFSIPTITVTKDTREMKIGVISLEPNAFETDEVNITGEKTDIEYQIDKKVINVSQNLNATGGTAIDVLRNQPSIQIDANDNVSLRGSQSFQLLIDGRPSVLDPNDALKQMPANIIDKIEVITNPSAKYDREGAAGIINIITKKQSNASSNGIVNAMLGSREKYSGDFTYNYRLPDVNFMVGGDYRKFTFHSDMTYDQYFYVPGNTRFSDISSDRRFQRQNLSGRVGIDWYINPLNTLAITANVGEFSFDRRMNFISLETNTNNSPNKYTVLLDNGDITANWINTGLNYQMKFAPQGHELVFDALYTRLNLPQDLLTKEFLTLANFKTDGVVPSQTWVKNITDRDELRFKADYTNQFSEASKLEAGAQAAIFLKGGNVDFLRSAPSNPVWVIDSAYTNQMDFTNNVYAMYATYSDKLFDIGMQLGIRAEYTDRLLDQKTTKESYEYKKMDYFPTLHFSKDLGDGHQLQLSYTRRIGRPNDFQLNPFPFFSSSQVKQYGNPDLKPEITDAVELNYTKAFPGLFISVENYLRHKTDEINFSQFINNQGVTELTFDNLAENTAVGTELMVNFDVAPWLKLVPSANLYYYKLKGTIAGIKTDRDDFTWNGNLSSTVSLSADTRIQLNAYYVAPNVNYSGNIYEMFGMNVSVRHELFEKALALTLQVNNVFKSNGFKIDTFAPNYSMFLRENQEGPIIQLNLSYRINNYKRPVRPNDGVDINVGG